jgi:hypothetical protein
MITVQVTCINPPTVGENMRFGLQDKNVKLVEGEASDDGSLRFTCQLTVKQTAEGKPNFLGEYTHGTVQERFLYLTLQALHGGEWQIVKRIKIHLKSITWEQVQAVLNQPDKLLAVAVDGQKAASVRLLGDGWVVHE